jgi:hypothetical protein
LLLGVEEAEDEEEETLEGDEVVADPLVPPEPALVVDVDPHSACCNWRADAWSAAVQFAVRQAAAALWKAALEHTQVRSV